MKRYRLTKTAQSDIDDIWLYIARESGSVTPAENVVWRLHKAIVNLAGNPRIGRPCPDIDAAGFCLPVGGYIIYYRVEESRIAITHVLHGKRDQAKAWKGSAKP